MKFQKRPAQQQKQASLAITTTWTRLWVLAHKFFVSFELRHDKTCLWGFRPGKLGCVATDSHRLEISYLDSRLRENKGADQLAVAQLLRS